MHKPKKILIGLKTVDQALELTDLACRLAGRSASILLVHVIELPDQTPLDAAVADLDAEARTILRAAERLVKRSGFKAKPIIVRSHSAGRALLEELRDKKTDCAILGYHHPHTLGEVLFGTTTTHLIAHAPCRVVVNVPPRG